MMDEYDRKIMASLRTQLGTAITLITEMSAVVNVLQDELTEIKKSQAAQNEQLKVIREYSLSSIPTEKLGRMISKDML